MIKKAESTEKAVASSSSTSDTCELKVKLSYPGKPTLAMVTSRPDANGAVTYQRLSDDGAPIAGAIGAAKIPII